MRILIAAMMVATAMPAFAFSDYFIKRYEKIAFNPSERALAIADGMNDGVPLQKMVKDGRLKSAYDCPIEFRVECFMVLHNDPSIARDKGATVIQEWGDWADATSNPTARLDWVMGEMEGAARAGFNLFSPAELGD